VGRAAGGETRASGSRVREFVQEASDITDAHTEEAPLRLALLRVTEVGTEIARPELARELLMLGWHRDCLRQVGTRIASVAWPGNCLLMLA
jgi:hypothetical protein